MASQVIFQNTSQLNAVRVRHQDAVKDEKTGKPTGKFKPSTLADQIVKPGEKAGFYLGNGERRVVIEELPT